MKKNIFRRGISGLLAVLMTFTALMGIGTTTAFAASTAGETAESYSVGFPRDGDANLDYSGTWGHDELHYMNGWTSGEATWMTTLHTIGSFDGQACYCIEPGVPRLLGKTYSHHGEDYWKNYPSDCNSTIDADTIKTLLGRIMQYGYQGNLSTSWRSQNDADADKLAHMMATQALVWETVVGERDANFNHVDPGSADAVKSVYRTTHPLYSRFSAYYDSIEASVQKHTIVPSFMARSTGKAQTVELNWDGSCYSATLTDTNGVLGNYRFSSNQTGVSFSVQGNVLTISTQNAPTGTLRVTAEKEALRKGVVVWSDGHYGPDGTMQDVVTYSATVSDPVTAFLNLKVSYGGAKIIKTSEDGKVDGITFTITGEGVNQTVTTDRNGEIRIDNLMPGIYTVTEQSYDKYVPQESHRVTVLAGQTATVSFNNVLRRGNLTVTKTSEDGLNQGVKFHLFGTSLSGLPVDDYAVTDENGVATFKDVLIGTGYTLEEMDTAIRYVVPNSQSAAVEWNSVTNKSFSNILKKFNVTVTKSDCEVGTAQGDASLAGAAYGIYKGDQLADTYYTDENGQFTTGYYVCGDDWTIREISPSEGYLLDSTVYPVGAEAANYTVELNAAPAVAVAEQVQKGNIAIIKHSDNGDTQIETPEEGAVFAVYLKSAGSYEAAKDTERDYLTCDENGFVQSKDLPYGVYTVHQVSGWEGRELMSDFDVFIAKDGETYRYLINNANFESFIKVSKVDAETGNTIPYAGAGFQIFRPDGSKVEMTFTYPEVTTIDTFYTNDAGMLITPEKLEFGKGYSLKEVSAPYGYVLSHEAVKFDVTEENSTEEGGVTVVAVKLGNYAQKGIIKISKTGEVFASVTAADGVYQPVYAVQGLAGATYEIKAAEDIYTPDGTLRCSTGDVVDTVTTGADGMAESKPLYLGKYEITEMKAPDGMIVNKDAHTAELVYAGQEIEITETAANFCNDRQKARISLSKVLEQNKQFGIGMNNELSAVTFGFYAAEELTAADGSVIPADGLIEILSLDENGKAVLKSDVPFGSYYVKEISTDSHYMLSDEKYPVTFAYAGQEILVVELAVNDGKSITNEMIYGEIHGMKKDEDGKALAGATIGLCLTDGTEPIMTTVSAEDGSFSFTGIPYGEYVVREIAAPEGYVMDETPYTVKVDQNGTVVEIEITNKLIRGSVQLTKVDKNYPDHHLSGAIFEV
ncbi:SpaA isopeptide-forming pilin-related protein [Hominenteromicrobium sp.]|uniref:SpaA isopeptide-forming pilin-related protein n=1 Tax=Hominenteromicrobium sp. TaxID=3073581 RepID=UPI003A91C014